MKKLAIALALIAQPLLASADVTKVGDWVEYRLDYRDVSEIQIVARQTIETTDGCNGFGFTGAFIATGAHGFNQRYVADFEVISTLMACAPLAQPRKVELNSVPQSIPAVNGVVQGLILLPAAMELVVTTH